MTSLVQHSVAELGSLLVIATVVAVMMWSMTDVTGVSRTVTAGITWVVAFGAAAVGMWLLRS
ncbi:hypothetical protein [Halorussus aquaticus]|uniref:Uncharacterized protein n=1 Tax=Halorussus aquaticus TaxID=2953748 RepID=A0ABD5PYG2_9EURY|nr:hypothetical protein [Halorussus aquaticus]